MRAHRRRVARSWRDRRRLRRQRRRCRCVAGRRACGRGDGRAVHLRDRRARGGFVGAHGSRQWLPRRLASSVRRRRAVGSRRRSRSSRRLATRAGRLAAERALDRCRSSVAISRRHRDRGSAADARSPDRDHAGRAVVAADSRRDDPHGVRARQHRARALAGRRSSGVRVARPALAGRCRGERRRLRRRVARARERRRWRAQARGVARRLGAVDRDSRRRRSAETRT